MIRTRTAWFVLLAAALGLLAADRSWARNYHISGGIQYVAQGDKEKAKGLYEDAQRLYGKAVVQLTEGIAEDEDDYEAYDYLGRAYAELDSTERAGWAFRTGIALACADEDEKKLCQRMQDNQKFYWGTYFQSALDTYRLADTAPSDEAKRDSIMAAAAKMWKAIEVYDQDGSTFCNLAAFYAQADTLDEAMRVVDLGLQKVPGDSCLVQRKSDLTVSMGVAAEARGEYDTAIATFETVLANDPSDMGTAGQLGQLYFKKGMKLSSDGDRPAAVAAYASAAKNFGAVYESSKGTENEADARYNYALALVQGEKYQEAATVIHAGLKATPKSLDLHRLMGNAYDGMDRPDDATKHRLVATVLDGGTAAEDAAAAAQASAEASGPAKDAAKLLKSMGPPEDLWKQTRGEYEVELWCWWSKFRTVTLVKGQTVSDLDFSQMMTAKAE